MEGSEGSDPDRPRWYIPLRRGGSLPVPLLSAALGHEVSHSHQVVAGGREPKDKAGLGPAPVAELME